MLTGTIINSLAILAGSLLGLVLQAVTHRSSKDVDAGGIGGRLQTIVMEGMALCVMYIGVSGSLKGQNTLIAIISIAIGAVVGELLDLDRRMHTLGDWVQAKTARLIHTQEGAPSVADGFVAASLLFCVGAMAIVGSLENGLTGNYDTLKAKSVIDGIAAIVFASSLGVGVAFSAAAIFVYQGAISLAAGLLAPLLSDTVIAEMTCVGSLLIVALSLNMLNVTKIKVMNLVHIYVNLIHTNARLPRILRQAGVSSFQQLIQVCAHVDGVPGQIVKALCQVRAFGRGHKGHRKQLINEGLGIRIGAAEGIGKAGDAPQFCGDAVVTLLDVVQHPGLKIPVGFPGAALHTVGAVPLKVAAIAPQIVELIAVGPDLHQAGIRHLPQLFPSAEVVRGQVRHQHDDGDAGLHAVLLQNGVHQIVIAAVAVVKGDEDRFFRQGLPRRQLSGQHRGIALGQDDFQISTELAGRDGHVVAVLPLRHHMVVHQHRQRLPYRRR